LSNLKGEFSAIFRTTNDIRQSGVMSPKRFAIYVNDLIKDLKSSGLGVKVGSIRICVVMYANDLLLMSETRKQMKDLLEIAGKYGVENGIRFNPDNSE